MQIRFRIVRHPCWSPTKLIKQLKENYLEDSEATPKSCLDLLFELLATTACTSYSNLLSESIRFLESQLQAERHRSAVLRQEAEGLRKSLEHSDAYFLVQQQVLEDLSAKQEKVNNLAKNLASIMGTRDIVSWDLLKWFQFWICFVATFICAGRQLWQPVYMICCFVPYICTVGELWCPVDVICVIAVIA